MVISTSSNIFILRSSFITVSVAFSSDIDGAIVILSCITPSSSVGINSVPSLGIRVREKIKRASVTVTITNFLFKAKCNTGLYNFFRKTTNAISFCTPCFSISDESTGAKNSAATNEPSSAKEMVNAIGENIFPSTSSRVKIGRKTMIMIATEKIIGRATSLPAEIIISVLLRDLFF